MDLWTRVATARAHVLVAEVPGAFRQRVALERAVDAAGWCVTETVADADVLAVVGEPGPELMAVIDRVWGQMSEPRARVEVRGEADIAAALVEARRALRAKGEQRTGAGGRASSQDETPTHGDGEHGDGEHDHGSMSPDGIPLAEGAEDRDGLEMDELHLPLGPVLAHWPAGVVLWLTLHGDVVAGARVERLDVSDGGWEPEDGPTSAARLLDATASVLTLAGLPAEAAGARRLRDRCLDGDPVEGEAIDGLRSRVHRNRVLSWLLRCLAVTDGDGGSHGLHDRLVHLLDRARSAVDGDTATAQRPGPPLRVVPELVTGQELAAVRLWMAALGADLTHDAPQGAGHG